MSKETTTDYRALSDELDAILDDLQGADVSIDDAVTKYQRGMKIVQELEAYLKTAENKISKAKADFAA